MNQKSVISVIVVVIFVAALVWWSKSASRPDTPASAYGGYHSAFPDKAGKISAAETFYDFGTISMKNGNVSKVFKISNPTDSDITLSKLTTSCMCTSAYILGSDGSRRGPFGMPGHGGLVPKANEIILAGESRDIEVVYDPNAHGPTGVGLIERAVFLEDGAGNITELQFKVNVTP